MKTVALVCLALAVAVPAAAQRPHRVTFRTTDGVAIAGTFYEPSHKPAPAVILVHMLTRARRDWDAVASRLASEGIAALAIDLRGHGESSAAPSEETAGIASMIQDVSAARLYLQGRPDVQGDRIGIAGASLGASLALTVASIEPSIRSLALLSPSMDYRGLRIEPSARKYGTRPMLLVASREDAYAMRTVRELTGRREATAGREQLILDQAGHGTTMLSRSGELARALVDWFHRTL